MRKTSFRAHCSNPSTLLLPRGRILDRLCDVEECRHGDVAVCHLPKVILDRPDHQRHRVLLRFFRHVRLASELADLGWVLEWTVDMRETGCRRREDPLFGCLCVGIQNDYNTFNSDAEAAASCGRAGHRLLN